MTADDITRTLIADLMRGGGFVMPHFTPVNWWECDVAEITKAGFLREYEIKVSRSDFRADRDKEKHHWDRQAKTQIHLNKHQLLAARDTRGPKQFYFVFPAELVDAAEVPEWAGFYTVRERSRYYRKPWNLALDLVRKAPVLHGTRCEASVKDQMLTAGYWRFLRSFYSGKDSLAEPTTTEKPNEIASTEPA